MKTLKEHLDILIEQNSSVFNYNSAKKSIPYKKILSLGFNDVSTSRQISNGTFMFNNNNEFFSAHKNGYVRKSFQFRDEIRFNLISKNNVSYIEEFKVILTNLEKIKTKNSKETNIKNQIKNNNNSRILFSKQDMKDIINIASELFEKVAGRKPNNSEITLPQTYEELIKNLNNFYQRKPNSGDRNYPFINANKEIENLFNNGNMLNKFKTTHLTKMVNGNKIIVGYLGLGWYGIGMRLGKKNWIG